MVALWCIGYPAIPPISPLRSPPPPILPPNLKFQKNVNRRVKFLFCSNVAARVWGTDKIVILPVWDAHLFSSATYSAGPPFTAGFRIPPLFRQSRDKFALEGRYWEVWIISLLLSENRIELQLQIQVPTYNHLVTSSKKDTLKSNNLLV